MARARLGDLSPVPDVEEARALVACARYDWQLWIAAARLSLAGRLDAAAELAGAARASGQLDLLGNEDSTCPSPAVVP